jgi:integrase
MAVQAFPISDVQAYLGHADIATTMIYVHHVPRTDAAARLSQLGRRRHFRRVRPWATFARHSRLGFLRLCR